MAVGHKLMEAVFKQQHCDTFSKHFQNIFDTLLFIMENIRCPIAKWADKFYFSFLLCLWTCVKVIL